MMDTAELRRLVSIESMLRHYGSLPDSHNRWRCLFPERHQNGDAKHSVTADDRAKCWSQLCFGTKGMDVFGVVGLLEGLPTFADQKRRVMEIGGITDSGNRKGQRRIVATYDYTDENGVVLFQVVRFHPKDFRQRRSDAHGGWTWNVHGVRLLLYHLPDLLKAETVLILEGEKDVDTSYRLGLPEGWAATCNAMGAGKWRPEYSDSLHGKRVVILPDADDPGRRHGELVARSLTEKAAAILTVSLPHGKDLSEWAEAGGTAEAFALLLDQVEPYSLTEAERTAVDAGPWSRAQTAKDFLSAIDEDVPMLYPSLLARGSITECFSPRGIGKTHAAHWLGVTLAKEGKRVLLLDRDNSRREVKRRLKAWGAEGLVHLKVLTRDEVPPLTDAEKWRAFPFQDYDLMLIDSLESSTEGCGEQDSAKPSRAIAPLLDIAHRDNGPAILVLGNTIKSGAHSRGSGVVEDRADVAFEVRDATDLKPSGMKDWWLELPAAGAEEWANRASRRKKRDTYRLAFIASKYRIGEEPDPFIWEITMPDTREPWTVRDVTADVVKAGEDAKRTAETQRQESVDGAAFALAELIGERAQAGSPMFSDKDAIPYLMGEHGLTRNNARHLIKDQSGTRWDRIQEKGKGNPLILVPIGYQARSAAEKPDEERPLPTSPRSEPISAESMDTGRRKSEQAGTASTAAEPETLFPPPSKVMPSPSGLCLQPLSTSKRMWGNP